MRNFSAPLAFFLFALLSTLTLTACGGETGGPDEPNTPDDPIVTEPGPNGECPRGMVCRITEPDENGACPTGMAWQGGPTPRCLGIEAKTRDEMDADEPEPEPDATAPPDEPREINSCSNFMGDPNWEWLNHADGQQYGCSSAGSYFCGPYGDRFCDEAECTFELLEGSDGCEAKCDPAMWQLVQDLTHLDGINFRFEFDVDGNTMTCNAM